MHSKTLLALLLTALAMTAMVSGATINVDAAADENDAAEQPIDSEEGLEEEEDTHDAEALEANDDLDVDEGKADANEEAKKAIEKANKVVGKKAEEAKEAEAEEAADPALSKEEKKIQEAEDKVEKKEKATKQHTAGNGPAAAAPVTGSKYEQAEIASCGKILSEISIARTQPEQYIAHLKHYTDGINGQWTAHPACQGGSGAKECLYTRKDGVQFLTRGGKAAIEETITFLQSVKGLKALAPAEGLCKASCDFVAEQGPTGDIGHVGPTGSSTTTRVAKYGEWHKDIVEMVQYGTFLGDGSAVNSVEQLIVGDGDPNKEHRQILFAPEWTTAGGCRGKHSSYDEMSTFVFTGGFTPGGKL